MQSRSGLKKWILASFSAIGIVLLLFVSGEEFGDSSRLSGTMVNRAAITFGNVQAAWEQESAEHSDSGYLDDTFGVTLNARNRSGDLREEEFELYFSRDQNFSREEDCQVDRRSLTIEASSIATVKFRSKARLVNCLDAGPWFAAVYSSEGVWSVLETPFHVKNGEAEVEIASLASDVAPRGTVELRLNIHRPLSETGFDGLYEFPVDVWLKQGEAVCLIEAEILSVPRDMSGQSGQSWKATQAGMTIDLSTAKAVDMSSVTNSPFSAPTFLEAGRSCVDCTPPAKKGTCRFTEGPVQVTAGPTTGGFQVVQEIYHHAPPVVVETGLVQVSVRAGEVLHVSRTAYNPSIRKVSWSSSSIEDNEWLIGMEDQVLPSRKPSTVGFTVSALDLDPGVYDATVSFAAADFYETETTVEVEITVLAARSVISEEGSGEELPADYALGNYPNPFNPTTTIRFELPQRERVSLKVYDVTGREIRLLQSGELSAGIHEVRFDASDLSSGTYLYRLTTPSASRTGKMVLVK